MTKLEFIETKAYDNIKTFLYQVDVSIKEEKQFVSQAVSSELSHISNIIESIPLDPSSHRFANNACLKVFEALKKEYNDPYLINSFGNSTRMDFGTGHELNYFCYLFVCYKKDKIKVNEVFETLKIYFRVVRSFINKYNIEPAGSQGIWGLDDYQFLPYLLFI